MRLGKWSHMYFMKEKEMFATLFAIWFQQFYEIKEHTLLDKSCLRILYICMFSNSHVHVFGV
jgi:hypothetical protein